MMTERDDYEKGILNICPVCRTLNTTTGMCDECKKKPNWASFIKPSARVKIHMKKVSRYTSRIEMLAIWRAASAKAWRTRKRMARVRQ
jgi:hypothetical protein